MNFGDDPSFANLKNVSEIPSIVFFKDCYYQQNRYFDENNEKSSNYCK